MQDDDCPGLLLPVETSDADDEEDSVAAAEEHEPEYVVSDKVLARDPLLRELLAAPCGQLSATALRRYANEPFPRSQ